MPTQLTIGDQLYASILANPADDTLRLAYADFLDETAGDETDHAALIRGMIAGVVYGGRFKVYCRDNCSPRWWCDPLPNWKLWPTQSPLRRANGKQWHNIMLDVLGSCFAPVDHITTIVFTRGFPGLIECPAAWWLENGDECCKRWPIEKVLLPSEAELQLLSNRVGTVLDEELVEKRFRQLGLGLKKRVSRTWSPFCHRVIPSIRWSNVTFDVKWESQ